MRACFLRSYVCDVIKFRDDPLRMRINDRLASFARFEREKNHMLISYVRPIFKLLLSILRHDFGDEIKVIPEFCIAHSYCARFLRQQRSHISARVQNIRDFPQTNLKSDIKAPFLLNEHGDPHFLFYKFNENNIRNN